MKSISTKLIALLTTAAILPLILFGILTIINARETAIISIQKGNIQSARYASGQIMQYINNSLNILESLAQNINNPDISSYQRERILRNYAINFKEFNYIETVKMNGFVLTSTKLEKDGHKTRALMSSSEFNPKDNRLSEVFITTDKTPAMTISTPLKHLGNTNGILVAELDLMNMWHLVDEMTIGKKGYVNIVTGSGRLIASGHPSLKQEIFKEGVYRNIDTLQNFESSSNNSLFTLQNGDEEITLAIIKLPNPLNWFIVIEQPAKEAYLLATSMTINLITLIVLFILIVTITGYFSGRKLFVKPIQTLILMTKKIAGGNLSQHITLNSNDELGELAKSFNQMSHNLIELKENVRKKERMAVFGRIASGLAHDLKHPIQSIKNVCRLLTQNNNADYSDIVNSTFTREFQKIDSFLENLHNLTKDIPYNPVNLDPNKVLLETIINFQQQLIDSSIELHLKLTESPTLIHADRFSLIRIFSNLILNAIQACSDGDSITIKSEKMNPKLFIIEIEDTGRGIEKDEINNIFQDFTTTKHSGLGLGLALCKRILDQHNAKIYVESKVNKGTIFKLTFNRL